MLGFIQAWNEIDPLGHKEKEAKDEAYRIRNEDVAREEKWLERNSLSGRISEGMSHGLSLSAAAGTQGSMQQPTMAGLGDYMSRAGQSDGFFKKWIQQFLTAQLEGLQLTNLGKSQDLKRGGKNPVTGLPRPEAPKPFAASVDTALAPGKDPSNILDFTYAEGADGGRYIVPSEQAKERSEDNFVQERLWDMRNYATPLLDRKPPKPPQDDPGPGREWVWYPGSLAYFSEPIGSSRADKAYAAAKKSGFMQRVPISDSEWQRMMRPGVSIRNMHKSLRPSKWERRK